MHQVFLGDDFLLLLYGRAYSFPGDELSQGGGYCSVCGNDPVYAAFLAVSPCDDSVAVAHSDLDSKEPVPSWECSSHVI